MAGIRSLIAAVGTPLDADERLDVDAFEIHLKDQWNQGMTGALVAGTMGLMQLLRDQTYRQLVDAACEFGTGNGEIMIGAGDASFARTRDRIEFLNTKPIDGIVILCPYLIKFTKSELTDYFSSLADVATKPVFLYDLPIMTGTKLELDTVLTLAEHPNIAGIKCSGDFGWTRQLVDIAPEGFRVIVAQADLVDMLYRNGVSEQLDGVFALAPGWTRSIIDAGDAGDWALAAERQQQLSRLLGVLKRYGIFPAFTALLNARGVPGNFSPRPFTPLTPQQHSALLAEPIVQSLLETSSISGSAKGRKERVNRAL